MPRYRTTIWVEATVQTLEVVEIEAPTLEAAQAFAQNPNNPPDGVSIEDFIDSIDTYYGDSTGYYETSDGEVVPVLEEPSVAVPDEWALGNNYARCSPPSTLSSVVQAYSTLSTYGAVEGTLNICEESITPLRVVPLTGKIIPKGFTLKEYKTN